MTITIETIVEEDIIIPAGIPDGGLQGQVLAKISNNSLDVGWVNNSGGGSSKKRIGVLVDSMGVQNAAWGPSWVSRFEEILNQNGVDCEVKAFGINGGTFYKWNTQAISGSKTALQCCIDYAPHVVLFSALANDTLDNPVRTLAQVKSDIDYTVTHLRSALPTAEIYYGEQNPYDKDNFTPSNIKNKGLPPKLMALKTSGLLYGLLTPSILDDSASTQTKTELANYEDANSYIKAKTQLTGSFSMKSWLIARLGNLIDDGYHFNFSGDALKACAVISTLKDINAPFLANFIDQIAPGWNHINSILSAFLTRSGDSYVPAWPSSSYDGSGTVQNLSTEFPMDSWFYNYKADSSFYPTTLTNDTTLTGKYTWYIRGTRPFTDVYNAIVDHATQTTLVPFVPSGLKTDQRGNVETTGYMGNLPLPPGVYDFYLSVGMDCFGPFVLTLQPAANPPGTGTVTTVSVVSANGISGSVANPTTAPAITLSTSVSGLLKGSSGALVAATPGTDYLTGNQTITFTGDATGSGSTSVTLTIPSGTVTNAKSANMANGTIKGRVTAGTGSPEDLTASQVKSILAISTGDISGLGSLATASSVSLSTQATGTLQAAQAPAYTGDVTSSAGSLALTISNTAVTFAKMQNISTGVLLGRSTAGTGSPETISIGSGLSLSGGVLTATGSGSGSVTTVSVVSANGLAGSVATASTTPAITLSTTVTGLVKGNGTAFSAAVAGTDYLSPSGSGASLTGITVSQVSGAEATANKDATGGYAGLTLYKINFKNAANTFTSFLTNTNTAARTYTFQDRDGTIADNTDLALKAPLASPTFTGTPAAPTAAVDTNTTQVATTAYVVGQGYLKSATASSTYAPIASPTFTGTVTIPSGASISGYALLASPTFTGTPAGPTAAVDTNTTQLATTAFVIGQSYLKTSTASSTYAPIASPTFTGKVTVAASTTGGASANIPQGVAPTTPSNGDVWTTSTGVFARINGATSSFSGTNTGDQTITLTGDVTGSGTGSFAATVANNAITFAKMQNISTGVLLGRSTASTGNIETISIGSGLTLSGGTLSASGGGTGTVTSVSVTTANGFSGSVANSTTTPAITISYTVPTAGQTVNGGTSDPSTPSANDIVLYNKTFAGTGHLYTIDETGQKTFIGTSFSKKKIRGFIAGGDGSSNNTYIGQTTFTATGTSTTRTPTTTNFFTRTGRHGWVSSSTAGSLAGPRATSSLITVSDGSGLGGFFIVYTFGCSDAATVSGARQFVGMRNSISAPTNVDPGTYTNCIGIGHTDTDSNLKIYYGGSSAQTPIDLGANFPANTLSVDMYEAIFYCPANWTTNPKVYYTVTRLNTGHVSSGTLTGTAGTALPASTTLLNHINAWRCNNATALAVGLDFSVQWCESDF